MLHPHEAHLAYSPAMRPCPCCDGHGFIVLAPYIDHEDVGETDACSECDEYGEIVAPAVGDWVSKVEAEMKAVDAHVFYVNR